jgi:hypothetical protein
MSNILAVPGPGSKYSVAGANGAGFWAGLWHGLIAPIVFFVSLFTAKVRIYETNNTGRWYDCGFLIGASIAFGGGGSRVIYYQAPSGTTVIT